MFCNLRNNSKALVFIYYGMNLLFVNNSCTKKVNTKYQPANIKKSGHYMLFLYNRFLYMYV